MPFVTTTDGVDEDFPHGMPTTEHETINADLLEFLHS